MAVCVTVVVPCTGSLALHHSFTSERVYGNERELPFLSLVQLYRIVLAVMP
jgi:hypothetical protein